MLKKRKTKPLIYSLIIIFLIVGAIIIRQPQHTNWQLASSDQPVNKVVSAAITNWQDIPTEYHLVISKINVEVPVLLNVPGADSDSYLAALHEGVAQYKGTALPGEVGNVVIFGHSADRPSSRGPYSQIFNQINLLNSGDEIKFISQDEKHSNLTYSVLTQQIINPKNTDVIKQTNESLLTLITCWPPGNTRHRLVVTAKLQPPSE